MNVVDAGVVIELLAGGLDPDPLAEGELIAPHLIDSEVLNALRRLVTQKALGEREAAHAVDGFTRLSLTRFAADWLRPRIWELRHDLSAYDATYVALAELTNADALFTTDARLANAPGLRCEVRVL